MPRLRTLAAALLAVVAPLPAAAAMVPGAMEGIWMNPRGTVAVRTGPCGDRLCGWVVWASRQAQEDARDGGTAALVGTALLQDYRPDGDGSWIGTVFLPDRNRRFYSELAPVDGGGMEVKGCILHGLICRSQLWHHVAEAPRA